MRPPPPRVRGILRRVPSGAVEFDGGQYDSADHYKLLQLSRIELCDLAAPITKRLPDYPDGSEAAVNNRITLRSIRNVLASRIPDPL